MKATLKVLVVAVGLLSLGASPATAGGYLKISDIKGESTDEGHQEWIDVLSVDWGMERPQGRAGSARGSGRVEFSDLTVEKLVDSTSPSIMLKCASGERVPEVIFDLPLESAEGPAMIRMVLTGAMVTSVHIQDDSGDERASEHISINYTEIKVIYRGPFGDSEFGWDLRTGRGL